LVAQAAGDGGHLLLHLALQNNAFVDHGGDAVEQLATATQVTRLCQSLANRQQGEQDEQWAQGLSHVGCPC
jgi:hypothetical protein